MDEGRLKDMPLFAGLNRKERRALAPRADEVELEEGRTIVREGEWPYEFFAIEEGTAEVRRGSLRKRMMPTPATRYGRNEY